MLKTILDYILVEERLDHFFMILGLAGPVVGILAGLIRGSITHNVKTSAIKGFCIGFSGTLLYGLWLMYNGIVDHYGLDSVRGLMINLVLFILVGVVIGFFFRRFRQPVRD